MQLTIDTTAEPLADVMRVLGAAYGVQLDPATVTETSKPRRSRQAATSRGKATTNTAARKSRTAKTAGPAEIRKWASDNGYEVGTRGALPKVVSDAFAAAQH